MQEVAHKDQRKKPTKDITRLVTLVAQQNYTPIISAKRCREHSSTILYTSALHSCFEEESLPTSN